VDVSANITILLESEHGVTVEGNVHSLWDCRRTLCRRPALLAAQRGRCEGVFFEGAHVSNDRRRRSRVQAGCFSRASTVVLAGSEVVQVSPSTASGWWQSPVVRKAIKNFT
jgi:hypothetical protein